MNRTRYQHDRINADNAPDSAYINAEAFRASAEEGKLRQDDEGNLITSRDRFSPDHLPIIDLDISHVYVPSRTEGHGHLYLNRRVSFEAYREIIEVLAKHGIVGQGNLIQLDVYRHSAARLPLDFDDRKPFYERSL